MNSRCESDLWKSRKFMATKWSVYPFKNDQTIAIIRTTNELQVPHGKNSPSESPGQTLSGLMRRSPMKVSDVMTPDPIFSTPKDTPKKAPKILLHHNLEPFPSVLD